MGYCRATSVARPFFVTWPGKHHATVWWLAAKLAQFGTFIVATVVPYVRRSVPSSIVDGFDRR
jgi:hypothetical protein